MEMKKFVGAALAIVLGMSMCSCTNTAQPADTAVPAESAVETVAPTETMPAPTADLTLNTDGTLDGMEYRYNSTWNETSDPLTNATLRTYNIDLGSDCTIQLTLAAVNDEGTSAAVQNLASQTDDEREAVISSMLAAKEETLTDAASERAATPPSGTRAMWAFEGKTQDGQSVHGYSYVGSSQLYEVSVTTDSDAAYAAFEQTWKSLVNQLKFQDIEPVSTREPAATAAPAASTPEPATLSDYYLGSWSGAQDDGSSWMDITIDASSTNPNGYTITGTRIFPESGETSYYTLNATEEGDSLTYTGDDTSGARGAYGVHGTIALGDGDTPGLVMSLTYERSAGQIAMWFYLDRA